LAARIGLYYPFIHFREDSWIKLAALYWGKVARIVPPDYPIRDSRVVRELDAGLDLVVNQSPETAAWQVGPVFVEAVSTHSDLLRDRYRVELERLREPRHRWRHPPGAPADDELVAWIHVTKMPPDVREVLLASGMAIASRGDGFDQDWIGVHPKVAEVYMTALAEKIAFDLRYEPVTDDPLHHVAASGWSVERLTMALLGGRDVSEPASVAQQPAVGLAFLAVQTLIPKNLEQVPVARIVEIRTKYGAELTAFQDELASLGDLEELRTVSDADVLRDHLQLIYDERIQPLLASLKRDLKLLQVDTALSVVDMKVAAPGAIVGSAQIAGGAASPAVAVGSGVAVGTASLLLSQRRRGQQRYRDSPAAYLLRVEEGLNPGRVSERVQRGLRQFIRGV
jgi:hypothetical protein